MTDIRSTIGRYQLHRKMGLVLVLMLLAVSVLVSVQWRQHDLMALSVQSGSMQPLIGTGDAVVVRKMDPNAIRVGDVVSYPHPDQPAVMVTHRVVMVDYYTGRLVTKGDANASADPAISTLAVTGIVEYTVPRAGYMIDFLRSWLGLALLVYLPAAAVVGYEVWRLARWYLLPTYALRR